MSVEVQWWNRIVLLYQRAKRHHDGGKSACYTERCEGTRLYTRSMIQWVCFKARRKIKPQFQCKRDQMYRSQVDMGHAGHGSTRKYSNQKSSIFKGIHKQRINKRIYGRKKTAKSQMKERGSRLKETSNGFLESVFFHNSLYTLLAYPSLKHGVLKMRMLPCRHLDEMGHTSPSSWKETISPMLQEVDSLPTLSRNWETMFTLPCTLKSTWSICLKTWLTVAQAAGKEELDDNEGKEECQ